MVEKWHTDLCPESQNFLSKNMSESFNLSVKMASNNVYAVFSQCTVEVDPSHCTCTCRNGMLHAFHADKHVPWSVSWSRA